MPDDEVRELLREQCRLLKELLFWTRPPTRAKSIVMNLTQDNTVYPLYGTLEPTCKVWSLLNNGTKNVTLIFYDTSGVVPTTNYEMVQAGERYNASVAPMRGAWVVRTTGDTAAQVLMTQYYD